MNTTGRDNLIVMKALAYAIESIERLPSQWQEWSDKEDMIALLRALCPSEQAGTMLRLGARGHLERRGLDVSEGDIILARHEGTVVTGVFDVPN